MDFLFAKFFGAVILDEQLDLSIMIIKIRSYIIENNKAVPFGNPAEYRNSPSRDAQEQRQWSQAEEYYQKALEILVEFNDRHEQAKTYHELGIITQEQREWSQAKEYYQKALEIWIESNDQYSQAKSYHQLGSIALDQKYWEQAREYLIKTVKIFFEFEGQSNLGIVLRTLNRLFQKTKDSTIIREVAEILECSTEEVTELFSKFDSEE